MTYTEILEACWKGYRQAGMKKKGDRMVPNCVPVSEQEMEEDLKKWFKEKWVRFGPDGKIRGDCARGSSSEGKPKCLPQSKAHALGKKGRASAAAKKRREDPNPERRGAAKNVATKVREQDVAEGDVIPFKRPESKIDPKVRQMFNKHLVQQGYSADEIARMSDEQFTKAYYGVKGKKYVKDVRPNWTNDLPDELDEQGVAEMDTYPHPKSKEGKRLTKAIRDPNAPEVKPQSIKKTVKDATKILDKEFQKSVKEQHDWDDADEFGMPVSEFFPEKQPQGHYKVYYMTATDHKLMGRYATRDQAEQRIKELKADYPDNKFIVFASQRGMSEAQTDYQKRRQRERDVDAGRPVKPLPKNPRTDWGKKRAKEKQDLDEKQDACYRKVKSRYKVWPSAYASGALVQCRKKGAANWGTGGKKK